MNSLPDREISAGIAEVIKYGCVWDLELLGWLDTNMARLRAREPDALTHAIYRSCSIKAAVVAQDEREEGLRAILNFGHTFGHAIEAATGYQVYLHGEAVGLGMLMAADLSRRLGMIDTPARNLMHALVRARGCPSSRPDRLIARPRAHADGQEGARGQVAAGAARAARERDGGRKVRQERARGDLEGAFRMSALAAYAAHESSRRGRRHPEPRRPTGRSISATATASSTPRRSAGWSTRPRCSSITRATCTAPGSRIRWKWRKSPAPSPARSA